MPTSPDRSEIQEVIDNAPVETEATPAGRNAARRHAVEVFLDDDETYNLDMIPSVQGVSLRDMILSDLHTYEGWESEEVEES